MLRSFAFFSDEIVFQVNIFRPPKDLNIAIAPLIVDLFDERLEASSDSVLKTNHM